MSSEALFDQVRQIVSTLFCVDLDQVTSETSYETIEKWDSMGHLILILEIEQQYDIQLEPEQVELMVSVMAIVQILEAMSVTTNV